MSADFSSNLTKIAYRWSTVNARYSSSVVTNAIQHGSPASPITVSLTGEPLVVVVKVHNGGKPIPPCKLHNIFEPLVRGASTQGRKVNVSGSIGLGLFIAREVAESHGGRIEVSSTAKDGTSFTIRLPRATGA